MKPFAPICLFPVALIIIYSIDLRLTAVKPKNDANSHFKNRESIALKISDIETLSYSEFNQILDSFKEWGVATTTVLEPNGIHFEMIIPKTLHSIYLAKPQATLNRLKSIAEKSTPHDSHLACCYAVGLRRSAAAAFCHCHLDLKSYDIIQQGSSDRLRMISIAFDN